MNNALCFNEIRTAVLLIKILCGYEDFSLFGAPSSKVKFAKVYGGMDVELHLFVTSALDGIDWSSSVTGERIFSTHRRRGWLSPRAGLETMQKMKIFLPAVNRNQTFCSKREITDL